MSLCSLLFPLFWTCFQVHLVVKPSGRGSSGQPPFKSFRQQEERAQQKTEVLLKYHRLGNNLHPNHWGKGRQNSDGRATMVAPPKKMQTGKFKEHSRKPSNPTESSLETILDCPEKGTTKRNPCSSFPIEHDQQRVTAATPTRNTETSSQGPQ